MKTQSWLMFALLSIGCASAGQILLKMGVRGPMPADAVRHPIGLLLALTNPYICFGIAAYAASMVLWLGAIRGQELSSVYPLAALGYVTVTVISIRVFGDSITVGKVVGTAFIIIGVGVLNVGPPIGQGAKSAMPQGTHSILQR